VTTEDDFHAALDAQPDDWHTRLVFADWLEEQGDPRAEGYRALGVIRKRSYACGFDNKTTKKWTGAGWIAVVGKGIKGVYCLPEDWFGAIKGLGRDPLYRPRYASENTKAVKRRAVEDAVALAFARLPPDRRANLLATRLPAKRTTRKPAKPTPEPAAKKPAEKKAPAVKKKPAAATKKPAPRKPKK
jgi:uncharacterized protein (TIGR02996 family)